ncbi:hypothetical protein EV182_002563, partial [Spiromyces aspiralis]
MDSLYEQSVDICLRARVYPELHKSLIHLVNTLYRSQSSDHERDISERNARSTYTSLYILYWCCYVRDNLPILRYLESSDDGEHRDPPVEFALKLWRAVIRSNYVQFSQLKCTANPQQLEIISHIIPAMRKTALAVIRSAYLNMAVSDLLVPLAMSQDDSDDDNNNRLE